MKLAQCKLFVMTSIISVLCSMPAYADDLATVYRLALDNDPVINRAKAQKEVAYQRIPLARASLLPQISGSVSYSMVRGETARTIGTASNPGFDDTASTFSIAKLDLESDALNYGINLNLSLYDHANYVGLDQAELAAQQADATLGYAVQTLIMRTTNAYLAVLRAKDDVEFAQAELKAIERQLEQTKQRFEVGLTAITDVHEAQANYDNALARQIRFENTVELRLEELREITGVYHAKLHTLDTERFAPTAPNPAKIAEWVTRAEEKNLNLLAQRFAKDVAQQDIALAQSRYYPTLDLNAGVTRDDSVTTTAGVEYDAPALNRRSLGLNLSVPLFTGGANDANREIARTNFVIASENLEQSYRETVRRVRSSFNDVRASLLTIKALEQSVVSAQSALRATEAGFEVGTRTIVDVLNSTRNLFDARRNLAGARYQYIQAMLNLKYAGGELTERDVRSINNGLVK